MTFFKFSRKLRKVTLQNTHQVWHAITFNNGIIEVELVFSGQKKILKLFKSIDQNSHPSIPLKAHFHIR